MACSLACHLGSCLVYVEQAAPGRLRGGEGRGVPGGRGEGRGLALALAAGLGEGEGEHCLLPRGCQVRNPHNTFDYRV